MAAGIRIDWGVAEGEYMRMIGKKRGRGEEASEVRSMATERRKEVMGGTPGKR